MKFPSEIDNIKTLKKGMKIKLIIDDEHTPEVLEHIHKFHNRDLIVTLEIDAEKEKEKLNQITPDQRKKIYALFKEIAESTGHSKEDMKRQMKKMYIADTDYPYEKLSLANLQREYASSFIEYLIEFCFEYGIEIKDKPKEYFENLADYTKMCYKHKICVVCGKTAEKHHNDAIGMGRNRKTVDDSELEILPLCREHHTEAHQIGKESFVEKYHVKPVKKKELTN